jgi:DNA ligase-1
MASLVGEFLARLDSPEAQIAARFFVGRPLPLGAETNLNISGRAIWRVAAEMTGALDDGEDIFASAVDFGEVIEIVMRRRSQEPEPTLSIIDVSARFEEISGIEGRQSRKRRLEALRDLLALATSLEAKYLTKVLIREMRHGVSEGLMVEAIAKMAQRPVTEVRHALMLEGDLGRVVAEFRGGVAVAPAVTTALRLKPLKPMLAHTAQDVAEAFHILNGNLALEHKLDGARVQIHKVGDQIKIFSRRLNEITNSLPEVVEMIRERLGERQVILDGEVIAVDVDGLAMAFQELMTRFRRVKGIEQARAEQPTRLYVFDLLALEGELMIARPYAERFEELSQLAEQTQLQLPGRIEPANLAEGEKFYADAVNAGHEGIMAKGLDTAYTPGARGRGWLKIKHTRTLDLVIVAADWGYGRRHGWLSNYHLAVRDEQSGQFLEVGKTFKGLSDEQFRQMTEALLALKTSEHGGTVVVQPRIVVEVAYNDIQRSPQYEVGMALRFARIVRIRDDKTADQADTVTSLTEDYERQVVRPLADKT